jgi:hypothetical protein
VIKGGDSIVSGRFLSLESSRESLIETYFFFSFFGVSLSHVSRQDMTSYDNGGVRFPSAKSSSSSPAATVKVTLLLLRRQVPSLQPRAQAAPSGIIDAVGFLGIGFGSVNRLVERTADLTHGVGFHGCFPLLGLVSFCQFLRGKSSVIYS